MAGTLILPSCSFCAAAVTCNVTLYTDKNYGGDFVTFAASGSDLLPLVYTVDDFAVVSEPG